MSTEYENGMNVYHNEFHNTTARSRYNQRDLEYAMAYMPADHPERRAAVRVRNKLCPSKSQGCTCSGPLGLR